MKTIGALLAIVLAALVGSTVTDQHLREAQTDPATWLTYGKNYWL